MAALCEWLTPKKTKEVLSQPSPVRNPSCPPGGGKGQGEAPAILCESPFPARGTRGSGSKHPPVKRLQAEQADEASSALFSG